MERPNRFIAYVEIAGKRETVHVKNTGRCRELLTEGATVYLEENRDPHRKTGYDLVAVDKAGRLINMDSQAPNRAVEEWLRSGALFPDLSFLRPETKYGNSRFDFYMEAGERRIFMEVKGVTLEEDGVVLFPDAPSERALKHVEELIAAQREGYETYILFVVQMKQVRYFSPNERMQPAFAEALSAAGREGVGLLAYDCDVTRDGMTLRAPVEIRLGDAVLFGNNSVDAKIKLRKGCLEDIPKPLLKWYDTNRRILPWREDPTPYHVWVSEIMLQQTRVEAVKPYYDRFMRALPDVGALAEAEEEALLKLWEGLGYYNRVRNLQKAAVQIMEEYGGSMPDSYEELLKLKGIGSYTAGAIASIAFGKPEPAVDGNVLRVLSRVGRREEDITLPAVKKAMEDELRRVMPDRPGAFNQALMEIGATVCIPNGVPHCEDCPLSAFCMAYAEGVQALYPRKRAKKQRTVEEKTVLVVRDENAVALHKRPDRGLLAGMYEFPSLEGFWSADRVERWLADRGLRILRIVPLPDAKHIFTHKEWHMHGFLIRVDELAPKSAFTEREQWIFAKTDEAEKSYPVPSAFAAYTDYVNMKLGNEKYRKEHET